MTAVDSGSLRRAKSWARWTPDVIRAAWLVAFGIAYYNAYCCGMAFTQSAASPFWFPDSILLCALLKSRPRDWWIFIAITLPIRLFADFGRDVSLWYLLATWGIDAAKGFLAAAVLRRFYPSAIRLQTIRDFAIFGFVAALLVPAALALAGAALRASDEDAYLLAWKQWFLGDALTQLVLTPAILCWMDRGLKSLKALTSRARIEAAATLGALAVSAFFAGNLEPSSNIFAQPIFFIPILLQFWMAIRFGMLGGSVAVAVWALILARAAVEGHGPFAGHTPAEMGAALQNYLVPRAIAQYLVALAIEQTSRAQEHWRESEERFCIMANSTPVMVWMSGTDKLCNFFNQGWLNFTGRSLKQELGNGWAQSVHPDDLLRCLETYESAFDARQPFEMEYRLRRHDGQYRWILDHGVPRFEPNGAFSGYVGSCIDITGRKQADELNQTLAHLQRLSVLGELTAAITHEIRQPLNAISLNTSAARNLLNSETPPLEELRTIVSELREDIERTTEVINRTRALARKHEIAITRVDIQATITDVLRLLAQDSASKGVRLRSDHDSQMPAVLGDKTQLQQVLLNLVANAMEATKEKPKTADITIRSQLFDRNTVRISVIDRGSGVAPERLSKLFEPFFTTKDQGLGLGLAVSQSIIEAHGGRIWARPNPDGGLTVHFTLKTAAENGQSTQA